MTKEYQSAKKHLYFLCETITNRCVGSKGNVEATKYFKNQLKKYKWKINTQEFRASDWNAEQAVISFNNQQINANSSPYSRSISVKAETITVSNIEALEGIHAKGKILILKDNLTKEQLMPKSFVFYNPEHHKKIISNIEKSNAAALVFIVNKNGRYEGGEYPFPIIEDGDFLIPSVFISEEDGEKIISENPKKIEVVSKTIVTPSKGFNVIGRKGNLDAKKITITAHIDAKKNVPGAIDNATGIVSLLLLAEIMKDYNGSHQIELIALNGEDYYSIPGQMTFLESKKTDFSDIALNINIDGAGFNKGKTAVSFFNLSKACQTVAENMIAQSPDMIEGIQWFQGDHSMFLQNGVPAIAITSDWLLKNVQTQNITHTQRDHIDIVEIDKILEIAFSISAFIKNLA